MLLPNFSSNFRITLIFEHNYGYCHRLIEKTVRPELYGTKISCRTSLCPRTHTSEAQRRPFPSLNLMPVTALPAADSSTEKNYEEEEEQCRICCLPVEAAVTPPLRRSRPLPAEPGVPSATLAAVVPPLSRKRRSSWRTTTETKTSLGRGTELPIRLGCVCIRLSQFPRPVVDLRYRASFRPAGRS